MKLLIRKHELAEPLEDDKIRMTSEIQTQFRKERRYVFYEMLAVDNDRLGCRKFGDSLRGRPGFREA